MKTTKTLVLLLALFLAPMLAAQDQTEALPAGTKLSLVATADGNPAPTFEWFKDGVKVGDGPTFVVEALAQANAGAYTVKATNTVGSSTSDRYVLQIGTAPSKPTIKVVVEVSVTVTTQTTPPTK